MIDQTAPESINKIAKQMVEDFHICTCGNTDGVNCQAITHVTRLSNGWAPPPNRQQRRAQAKKLRGLNGNQQRR